MVRSGPLWSWLVVIFKNLVWEKVMEAPGCLRINDAICPVGVDDATPAFSWRLAPSSERDQGQSAYRILVATEAALLSDDGADIWDSGQVACARSAYVGYEGPALRSAGTYWWKVRVWNRDGEASPWSEPACFGTGLWDSGDWRAKWIGRGPCQEPHLPHERFSSEFEKYVDEVEVDGLSTLLRTEFAPGKSVRSARVFASGLGFYELYVNGRKVGDHVNGPARTEYRHRVLYDAFDITDVLQDGANAVGLMLGSGWFNAMVRQSQGDPPVPY